jgi:nitrite reductase/ring-hydroxylating ferredoxin subunit
MKFMSDYIFAAKLATLTEDVILPLDYDDAPIAITKKGGRIFAFGDVCTHDDGPLNEGEIERGAESLCVICPRHGATFDLLTGKGTFPAAAPIPIYHAKVVGDAVWVQIDSEDEE